MNSVDEEFDVVIVGAGMVGAALAAALGDANVRVAILDEGEATMPNSAHGYDLRVSAINLASEAMLRQLQVWRSIVEHRVSPYRHMFVWDEGSTGSIEFESAELGEPYLGHIIENGLIIFSLHGRLREMGNVSLRLHTKPRKLEKQDSHIILHTTEDILLKAKLVIGADGAKSWVRDALGISNQATSYNQSGIVAQVQSGRPHNETAWQRFLATGPLAFLPLASGECSIVWSCDQNLVTELLELDDHEFAQRLARSFDYKLGEITRIGPRSVFSLSKAYADHYTKHRGVLVGDAAHSIHPLAGQGVNLGFADAAALAEVLTTAVADGKDIGSPLVLRRYERWRKGDNLLMLNMMDVLLRLFQNATTPVPQLRGFGLQMVNNIEPLKGVLARRAMGLAGDLPKLIQRYASD